MPSSCGRSPYRDSNRIVVATIEQDGTDSGRFDEPTARLAMRGDMRTFEAVATYDTTGANLTGGAQPNGSREHSSAVLLRGDGRAAHDRPDVHGRRAAARRPTGDHPELRVVGSRVRRRRRRRRSHGQARRRELQGRRRDAGWIRFRAGAISGGRGRRAERDRPVHYVDFVGRLRPGRSPASAREELRALRRANAGELPARALRTSIQVVPLHESLRGGFRRPSCFCSGSSPASCSSPAPTWQICCWPALQHGAASLGFDWHLGAGRGRLIRQLLIESVLLACLGAIPGVLVAYAGLRMFTAFGPPELAQLPGIAIDTASLLFTLAVTVGTGLLFGIAPAFAAGRADAQAWLKPSIARRPRQPQPPEARAGGVRARGRGRADDWRGAPRQELRPLQLHRSRLPRRPRADGLHSAAATEICRPGGQREFSDRVLERLRSVPSIVAATHSATLLDGMMMTIPLPPQFTRSGRANEAESFAVAFVGGQYFRTFGIPIVAGSECPAAPERRFRGGQRAHGAPHVLRPVAARRDDRALRRGAIHDRRRRR